MSLQSFSLRRTVTPRPIVMPTPATNVSVTAILEKANAIRQVIYMSSFFCFPFSFSNSIVMSSTDQFSNWKIFRLLEVMMEKMMIIGVTLDFLWM